PLKRGRCVKARRKERSGRKRGAAAASRRCVGITDNELCTFEIVFVVDFGAKKVLEAHGVDQKLDTGLVDGGVVFVDGFVEGEAVLETGTAATLDEDAQLEVGVAFFEEQVFDLGCGGIGKDEGRRRSLQVDGFGKAGH